MTNFAEELVSLLRAGYSLVATLTWEEERVETALQALAKGSKRAFHSWSSARGVAGAEGPPAHEAIEALAAVAVDPGPSIWMLKDLHPYLGDPRVVRALRDLAADSGGTKIVVLVAPHLTVPRELEKDMAVVDVPLPTEEELQKLLADLTPQLGGSGQTAARLAGPELARAARGLTLREAKRAFRRTLDGGDAGAADRVSAVIAEKRRALRGTRFLEFTEPAGSAQTLGGVGELKRWLTSRAAAFRPEAKAAGLPAPKGVFLLGVQGCGKSLAAKAVADQWRLPLLRFDAGAVVDGGADGPAANLKQALAIAEAISPSVLWVDEIEKVFGSDSRDGDSATTRVMGSFVTWLQEKTAPVFVVATANRVDRLPPELLRKGRFDEIFFVDLPGLHDRIDILKIHLARRGRSISDADLAMLAKQSEKFSGAEIEAAVIAAMFAAFAEKRDMTARDVRVAIEETVPLAITMEEEVRALKDWAKPRTRPAALDTRRADLFAE